MTVKESVCLCVKGVCVYVYCVCVCVCVCCVSHLKDKISGYDILAAKCTLLQPHKTHTHRHTHTHAHTHTRTDKAQVAHSPRYMLLSIAHHALRTSAPLCAAAV